MKVKVGDVEYEVRLTVKAWPLLAFIDDRRLNAPRSAEEAVKKGEELEQAMEKLMDMCVTPKPPRELWSKLLGIINIEENRQLKEAIELYEKFRGER
ncbi:MAG: hypothetical protein QXI01_00025 [Nitrososphaerota archaeon]